MAGYAVSFSVTDNATKQIDAINRRIAALRAPIERAGRSINRFVDVTGLSRLASGFTAIGRSAFGAFRAIASIVPAMGALTGAATLAGMTQLVDSFATLNRQLDITARSIGIGSARLQELRDATRLAGGDASDMDAALRHLTSTIGAAVTGDQEAANFFNQLGINVRDANGNLRTADDLLPEVFKKLDAMQNPTDRAKIASRLLGDEYAKLYELFRRLPGGMDGAIQKVRELTGLTNDQKEALDGFDRAQNSLGVSFGRLGQQISAVMAKHMTPMMEWFDAFVREKTPAIAKATDYVATKFGEMLSGMARADWTPVNGAFETFIGLTKQTVAGLELIGKAAIKVANIFMDTWAGRIVKYIGEVSAALAKLGITNLRDFMQSGGLLGQGGWLDRQGGASGLGNSMSNWWWGLGMHGGMGGDGPRPPPVRRAGPRVENLPPAAPNASRDAAGQTAFAFWKSKGLTDDQAAGMAAQEVAESTGDPTARGDSGEAHGLYQWHADRRAAILAGTGIDVSNASAEQQREAAWWELQNIETEALRRLREAPNAEEAGRAATQFERPRDRAGEEARRGQAARRIRELGLPDQRRPAALPPLAPAANLNTPGGGAMPNGRVNVSITHTNPPPGSSVTASASGTGIALDPPRTERQQMQYFP